MDWPAEKIENPEADSCVKGNTGDKCGCRFAGGEEGPYINSAGRLGGDKWNWIPVSYQKSIPVDVNTEI